MVADYGTPRERAVNGYARYAIRTIFYSLMGCGPETQETHRRRRKIDKLWFAIRYLQKIWVRSAKIKNCAYFKNIFLIFIN